MPPVIVFPHDVLWSALVKEVRQPGAHAPWLHCVVAIVLLCSFTNQVLAQLGVLRDWKTFVMSCSFTHQVLAQLDALSGRKSEPTRTMYTCSRRSSRKKWQSCAFLHSAQAYCPLSGKKRIPYVSRLEALSRERTLSRGCCRWLRVGLRTPKIQNGVPRDDCHREGWHCQRGRLERKDTLQNR